MNDNLKFLYDEGPQAIPSIWRNTIFEIVEAFKNHDIGYYNQIKGIVSIDTNNFEEIISDINTYGEFLISLPDQTWESSQCIWKGDSCWHIFIDLYTISEGKSDLILFLTVEIDKNNNFSFYVNNFYVP
ncbi:hypothetical protein BJD20_17005 [Acinetobacter proteolyticus]|jgi:hypothetical protein|uniref:DUF7668 domain-containing protein n=1 Tax=Acinetobacter proteolyticus TaxID=1776741 RepID=UPI0008631CB8|nr:hypothetical protein [Acinetobacter proteolyticus]OEY95090.1 hypothetical protein BJD20_17005 [Acinetobacter proteolyticus]WEI17894.1 hypothetical protein PY247_16305 [Acinetobacter proteolyticus]